MVARLAIAMAIAGTAYAGGLRVVTTGDSHTNAYSNRLQAVFNSLGDNAVVSKVASGGCHAERYAGHEIDPTTGTIRDYAAEVLALDPDVIVFMLGTNDAFKHVADPAWFGVYVSDVEDVFFTFKHARNRSGNRPIVLVLTPTPVLDNVPVDTAISDLFAPWLVFAAAENGFILLDTNALIQTQPDWQAFYAADGIHLWGLDLGADGYWWLAGVVRDTVMANLRLKKSKVRR